MTTMLDLVRSLVGPVPPGFEYAEYIAAVYLAGVFVKSVLALFPLVRALFR